MCACRVFTKDGDIQGWQSDPEPKMPNTQALKHQLAALVVKEKQLLTAFRERERNFSKILYRLKQDEANPTLVQDPFFIALLEASKNPDRRRCTRASKVNLKAISFDGDEEKEYDPLLPFLGPQGKATTKEQAIHAKEECLKKMKSRLLKRMEIMNRRLHKEVEVLEFKRNQFERCQASNIEKCALERELEEAQEESEFKCTIIKERLARHEKLAIQRMHDLNRKLVNDPRLALLNN